jgi:hypothetical protein
LQLFSNSRFQQEVAGRSLLFCRALYSFSDLIESRILLLS